MNSKCNQLYLSDEALKYTVEFAEMERIAYFIYSTKLSLYVRESMDYKDYLNTN